MGEASETLSGLFNRESQYVYIYYIPPPLTVHFPVTRSVRYQPILHTLYYTQHCACVLNNVVLTTITEMVEIEILDGRVGKRSVERVRYVINNLLHFGHMELFHSYSVFPLTFKGGKRGGL